jgi:hypothetical protein
MNVSLLVNANLLINNKCEIYVRILRVSLLELRANAPFGGASP